MSLVEPSDDRELAARHLLPRYQFFQLEKVFRVQQRVLAEGIVVQDLVLCRILDASSDHVFVPPLSDILLELREVFAFELLQLPAA